MFLENQYALGYMVGPQDYAGMLQQQIVNAESLGRIGETVANPASQGSVVLTNKSGLSGAYYAIGETVSSPHDTGSVVIGPPPKNAALGYWSPYGRAYKYSLGGCCKSCDAGKGCEGGLGGIGAVAGYGALLALPIAAYFAWKHWKK